MKNEYLNTLRKIKSVSMATVDSNGLPQVRIIDVMLVENNILYFCTARGKDFYRELLKSKNVAILGMTENYQTIRLNGKVEQLLDQREWIDKIFENNPMMKEVYPNESRYILEPFCLKNGTLEYFDLSLTPIFREYYSLGDTKPLIKGFEITKDCISCNLCSNECPQKCIDSGSQYSIQQEYCLHCGLCYEICPVKAVKRREERC